MLEELFYLFLFSFAVQLIMRKIAKTIGLADRPNERKLHEGTFPLVGGLSICIVLAQYLVFRTHDVPQSNMFVICISILAVIGAFDDKFDVSFKLRLVIQALVSIAMINIAGIELHSLGNILGLGSIELGFISPILTVLAVIAAINAFNMIDGIDGLLGGLSIVTFLSLAYLLGSDAHKGLSFLCLLIVTAMLPYTIMNLGLLGKRWKIFMGDAGSMLIGFTVIWLLLSASQTPSTTSIRPVTALWLIAVPLMDMVTVVVRRAKRGDSPFRPDREHIHHILQRIGFSSRQTLAIICTLATGLAGIGILGEIYRIEDYVMFYLFVFAFLAYAKILSYSRKTFTLARQKN
ncbi:UDP-N-acetylglucosamine--undecaprenyl-phosphate N-acetylglucosaminephosphotransferase [Vibrio rotiferianus]|uniref:UDP-N-acetylglucosamine--undecaprenyl-phosphate N-acetylglucosaminephosphotransferase n=1 Tax=Vibrio rotiferianus TaxID=190895 RepID=UPI0003A324E5|nr:UDP-N-acetylglucosamine--undecaprenyl-phosphate N-acetylglucosaminephosphotransferase [Vibrio rotiferianus]PIB18026.1 undecaprenylphosphate N-acetylglucosamine 1-phosphate transferase [Vibrio rotiferianus CAIM 577 = LMG 21460]